MRKYITNRLLKLKRLINCLFNSFKAKKQEKVVPETGEGKRQFHHAVSKNPYLQSKVLWNDMYGSLQVKLENSYRIIFILSLVIALAIVGFIVVAGESKVKPYVTVIHGDEVLTLDQTSAHEIQALHPRLAFFFTKNFIRSSRGVSVDGDVNAENKMGAYALVAGAATEQLKAFYAKNNPDTIARHAVKGIHITSVLRLSAHTMEVRWKEDWHDVRSGKLQQTKDYIAQLSYQFEKPSINLRILRVNPLGFVITQLSWSQDYDR